MMASANGGEGIVHHRLHWANPCHRCGGQSMLSSDEVGISGIDRYQGQGALGDVVGPNSHLSKS